MWGNHTHFLCSLGTTIFTGYEELVRQLDDVLVSDTDESAATRRELAKYKFEPVEYIKSFLGWVPWSGEGAAGQAEIIEHYAFVLRQLYERRDYERGLLREDQLTIWSPGETIQNWIRISAGHTVGKTKLASGLVNHFFDCLSPSIVYAFAPTAPQINDLLFKEIRADREGKGLPGRVLETPEVKDKANHFVKGRATSGGRTESIQGQHNDHLMFIIDEAEGIESYVYDAIKSMTGGGIAVVIMIANPRTTTSEFHRYRLHSYVASFQLSCLSHPNVVTGMEVVPNAVRREYVDNMLETECEEVFAHNADKMTFEVPWQPGKIYEPRNEFLWRVIGVPPRDMVHDSVCSPGRYQGAFEREPKLEYGTSARIGVDVARFGTDDGSIYVQTGDRVWLHSIMSGRDSNAYALEILELIDELWDNGVRNIHVRVDGGGGYGGAVIDNLAENTELWERFDGEIERSEDEEEEEDLRELMFFEVQFGAVANEPDVYYDLITELYFDAVEALKAVAITRAVNSLEGDLTQRKFKYQRKGGKTLRKLQPKEEFRKSQGRSPDHGDGLVLALAADHLFFDAPDFGFA